MCLATFNRKSGAQGLFDTNRSVFTRAEERCRIICMWRRGSERAEHRRRLKNETVGEYLIHVLLALTQLQWTHTSFYAFVAVDCI